ncbi:MAG: nucleotidyltransferase domain-containing protein [Nanoarchaeota archaeon]
MLDVHKTIIDKVVEMKSKDSKVVAILLFGSVARGTATKNSDIDIEIIYDDGNYDDYCEFIDGIKVDYKIWPKNKFSNRIKKYPFCHIHMLKKKYYMTQQE